MSSRVEADVARPIRSAPAAPPPYLGPHWDTVGIRQYGWVILPLRAFVGATFTYAGLQKLANPAYLDPSSPQSVQAQMRLFMHTSPIHGLLSLTTSHAGFVGVLIALGELAVGLATLVGLWSRLAAVGGLLLALTFFLTVSWQTTPYYYGSDIVFVFIWLVFILGGSGDVLSLDALIRARALREVAVLPNEDWSLADRGEIDRRTVLLGARAAAALAAVAGVTAGVTAAAGRSLHSSDGTAAATGSRHRPTTQPSPGRAHQRHTSKPATQPQPKGPVITHVDAVPVGQGLRFTDPRNGQPAWLLRPTTSKFVAFSAVCTHAGCTVDYERSATEFVCPCHQSVFSARNGSVLGGPAPSSLAELPVGVAAGQVYLA